MESGEKKVIHIPPRPSVPELEATEPPETSVTRTAEPSSPALEPAAMEPGVDDAFSSSRFIPPAVQKLVPLPPAPDPEPAPQKLLPSHPVVSRKMAILASAAAGLILLGTYLAYRRAKAEAPARAPEVVVDHLDLSELSALPEPLQPGAQAVMAGKFQLPAWFQSLEHASGGDLEYPVQEAIEEVQPTLRWAASAAFYHVAVLDPAHAVVARAEIYGDPHWTVPTELPRGAVYIWEVATPGQVRRNSFRVLDDTEAGWLTGLRMGHGQSHLVMGIASLELGLLTAAQREFQALAQEHPHSPEAAQLLHTVHGLMQR